MHQAQGNQRAEQLHLDVQLQIRVCLAADDVDPAQFPNFLALPDST